MDFETDVYDFRLPPMEMEELKKGLKSSGVLRAEEIIPDMHYSLRVSGERRGLCKLMAELRFHLPVQDLIMFYVLQLWFSCWINPSSCSVH